MKLLTLLFIVNIYLVPARQGIFEPDNKNIFDFDQVQANSFAIPTFSPTSDSTPEPTMSLQPTDISTWAPTSSPATLAPTFEVTTYPTYQPTDTSTWAPTSDSTKSPATLAPTFEVTYFPTISDDFIIPTFSPSMTPTPKPTSLCDYALRHNLASKGSKQGKSKQGKSSKGQKTQMQVLMNEQFLPHRYLSQTIHHYLNM